MFYQFDVKSPMASVVFWHKLKMSVQYGLGSQLVIDIDKVIHYIKNAHYTKHHIVINVHVAQEMDGELVV